MNAQDLIKITGQRLLFLGISSFNWSPAQFQNVARFAHSHGIDSLLVKVADGTNEWYGGMSGWHDRRNAILAEGVGAIPYMFSYGNKFGALDAEIDIMIAHLRDNSTMCADMEGEWDGQVQWAQHLTSRVLPVPGTFLVSTWADPSLHSWQGVIRALAPTTTVFMPQQYNNYLATFWAEFSANGATWIQPTVQLTQDFGANDPVAIARNAREQGHTVLSVWHYETAVKNPSLLDQIYDAFSNGDTTMLSLNDSIVQKYFVDGGDGSWKCKQTGVTLFGGNLNFYRSNNGLALFGLPLSNEIYLSDHPGTAIVLCERAIIIYDPERKIDRPPIQGDCYTMHIDSGLGQQLLLQSAISPLQGQIRDLQGKIKQISLIAQI